MGVSKLSAKVFKKSELLL